MEYIQTTYFNMMFSAKHTTIYDPTYTVPTSPGPLGTDSETSDDDDFPEPITPLDIPESGCTCGPEDSCPHTADERESGAVPFIRWGILENLRLMQFSTHGYDNILALTQHSINVTLKDAWQQEFSRASKLTGDVRRNLWKTANANQTICLAEYSYFRGGDEPLFSARFGPPELQIVIDENDKGRLGDGRVVLHLTMTEGSSTLLGRNGEIDQR